MWNYYKLSISDSIDATWSTDNNEDKKIKFWGKYVLKMLFLLKIEISIIKHGVSEEKAVLIYI